MQFGEGGFQRHVAGGDDADTGESGAGGVGFLADAADQALGGVEQGDAAGGGAFEGGDQFAVALRGVADAVGLQDQAADTRVGGQRVDGGAGNAGVEGEDGDGLIVEFGDDELFFAGADDAFAVQRDGAADFGKRGVVGRVEGVELGGGKFAAAVAAQQALAEVEADFADGLVGSEVQGAFDVVEGVAVGFDERDLGAGEDHRLVRAAEHEGQRRGAPGHGVGAVQDDEAGVVVPVIEQRAGDHRPVAGAQVGAVDGWQFDDVVVGLAGAGTGFQLLAQAVRETRHGPVAVGCGGHADGAAGVQDERLHVLAMSFPVSREGSPNQLPPPVARIQCGFSIRRLPCPCSLIRPRRDSAFSASWSPARFPPRRCSRMRRRLPSWISVS